MQKFQLTFRLSMFILLFSIASISQLAIAEDVPLVDGNLWNLSSEVEKKSFLVGASNLLSIEYTFQVKGKNPPTDKQSIIPRLYEKIDDISLDQTIEKIDQWYKKNPTKMNEPVLGVIWESMVKPNL